MMRKGTRLEKPTEAITKLAKVVSELQAQISSLGF